VIYIPVNPVERSVPFHQEKGETWLKAWQRAVGGYIEPVYAGDMVLLVNEDGIGEGLAFNQRASELANESMPPGDYFFGDEPWHGYQLFGNAVAMTAKEWDKAAE
jgi:hypothetical protein